MLGMTPLVSISERRLSCRQNSGLPYLLARRVVAVSTSRIVSPRLSRTVRNFAPAVITPSLLVAGKYHTRRWMESSSEHGGQAESGTSLYKRNPAPAHRAARLCYEFGTTGSMCRARARSFGIHAA